MSTSGTVDVGYVYIYGRTDGRTGPVVPSTKLTSHFTWDRAPVPHPSNGGFGVDPDDVQIC